MNLRVMPVGGCLHTCGGNNLYRLQYCTIHPTTRLSKNPDRNQRINSSPSKNRHKSNLDQTLEAQAPWFQPTNVLRHPHTLSCGWGEGPAALIRMMTASRPKHLQSRGLHMYVVIEPSPEVCKPVLSVSAVPECHWIRCEVQNHAKPCRTKIPIETRHRVSL